MYADSGPSVAPVTLGERRVEPCQRVVRSRLPRVRRQNPRACGTFEIAALVAILPERRDRLDPTFFVIDHDGRWCATQSTTRPRRAHDRLTQCRSLEKLV